MRFNCEFSTCKCREFIRHRNKLCRECDHARLWHSKTSSDAYLSPRKPAHSPIYVHSQHPRIFTPIQVAVFVPEAIVVYCDTIENLPI